MAARHTCSSKNQKILQKNKMFCVCYGFLTPGKKSLEMAELAVGVFFLSAAAGGTVYARRENSAAVASRGTYMNELYEIRKILSQKCADDPKPKGPEGHHKVKKSETFEKFRMLGDGDKVKADGSRAKNNSSIRPYQNKRTEEPERMHQLPMDTSLTYHADREEARKRNAYMNDLAVQRHKETPEITIAYPDGAPKHYVTGASKRPLDGRTVNQHVLPEGLGAVSDQNCGQNSIKTGTGESKMMQEGASFFAPSQNIGMESFATVGGAIPKSEACRAAPTAEHQNGHHPAQISNVDHVHMVPEARPVVTSDAKQLHQPTFNFFQNTHQDMSGTCFNTQDDIPVGVAHRVRESRSNPNQQPFVSGSDPKGLSRVTHFEQGPNIKRREDGAVMSCSKGQEAPLARVFTEQRQPFEQSGPSVRQPIDMGCEKPARIHDVNPSKSAAVVDLSRVGEGANDSHIARNATMM